MPKWAARKKSCVFRPIVACKTIVFKVAFKRILDIREGRREHTTFCGRAWRKEGMRSVLCWREIGRSSGLGDRCRLEKEQMLWSFDSPVKYSFFKRTMLPGKQGALGDLEIYAYWSEVRCREVLTPVRNVRIMCNVTYDNSCKFQRTDQFITQVLQ